jgi:hypothetical protein
MKKNFVITKTHIVRAPNVGQAKSLIFDDEGHGDVLSESISVEEIAEQRFIL